MARKKPVPEANQKIVLNCIHQNCPSCGQKMWSDYDNLRTIRTLSGIVRITLKVRRCSHKDCQRYHQVYRPEEEGAWALPGHEFGLDLIAYAGSLRYQEHQSVPQIHQAFKEKGINICQRSVSNVLDRYDELISVSLTDRKRSVADQQDPISEVVNGSCLAVRSALTDDGHPPLDAPGVRLHERLTQIHSSLEGVEKGATAISISKIEGYFSQWS